MIMTSQTCHVEKSTNAESGWFSRSLTWMRQQLHPALEDQNRPTLSKLRVVSRLQLGGTKSLAMVQFDDHRFLIGITANDITCLQCGALYVDSLKNNVPGDDLV